MKIAIASGKGGTGKTTLSVNLTDYLAAEGSFPVTVLADMDVEEPNSALFIRGRLKEEIVRNKMIPLLRADSCSSCGKCAEICNFNAMLMLGDSLIVMPQLCHSCWACADLCEAGALEMTAEAMGRQSIFDAGNFDFIESRLDIGQEQAVPLISQSIDWLDSNYPDDALIIIDSPPGSSCPVIEAAKKSDFVILVTEPTPFGLHDLRLAVGTMREIGRDFAVVVNRYGIGTDDVLTYCKSENIEIISKLPDDRRIAELYAKGSLIHPHSGEFASSLSEIGAYIGELYRRRRAQ